MPHAEFRIRQFAIAFRCRNLYVPSRMEWHVLYLKPRTEKKMAEFSEKLDFNYYLPLRRETKIYQRRKVTVDKPVFPGYFFVAFDHPGRLELLKTNNIVHIIEVLDQRLFLEQLVQVRRALRIDPELEAIKGLEKGKFVRITSGPFQGIEGCVVSLKSANMVRLNVDMIGQAIEVEVDKAYIESMD